MSEIPNNYTSRPKVLIIEDSKTQARRLQAMLQQAGLDAVLAFDGESGIEMARLLHPDAIILDVQMPEMNGFQVCRALKEMDDVADVSIIMLTRHDEEEAVTLGMEVGADDYIPKDAYSDAVLIETLRQMGLVSSPREEADQ